MSLRKTDSLTFRLTLLFAIASTVVLLALGFLVRESVQKHFEELDASQLASELQPLRQAMADARSNQDLLVLSGRVMGSGDNKLAVVVFDRNGKPYLSLGSASGFPAALLKRMNGQTESAVWEEGGKSFRGVSETVPTSLRDAPSATIAAAIDISHHHHFMEMFQITLWWFVAIASLLMGLLGWIAARHGLAPLKKIQSDTRTITASSLDQRLSVEQFPAELADLGNTINGMLARLENSFRRLSDFSADIAHELRTPVSNLMTQTQVALSKPRTAEEYHEILASNAEELDRMSRMISDMLFLAKADHGLIAPLSAPVALEKEFADLFGFYEALAEEKSIRLALNGRAMIPGDRLMLRRAFSNLLSNAIRHTPPGEEVRVDIRPLSESGQADRTEVDITNPAGIPAEHLPRLFNRFYRVDPSRHEASEGAGLGLAITQSIIQIHGGTIDVRSTEGGTTFIIRLPNAPSMQSES